MRIQMITFRTTDMGVCKQLFMISMISLLFFACRKDISQPAATQAALPLPISFHISTSRLVMLQGNANSTALTLKWEGGIQNTPANYTIEAAIRGTDFSDPVAIGSSDQLSASFRVKDFNQQMRKLIIAGNSAMVELRVKASYSHYKEAFYSDVVALEVTPYQDFFTYDNSHIIRIPGNYQNWKVDCAPKIISSSHVGEYEGYINFTNPYSQFLMVKGATNWDPRVTYNYIGANKIGFGGSVFSIFGGAGAYQLKVNMNTNTWLYTKISSWGLNGSAVANDANAELAMTPDDTGLVWSITTKLNKGSFRIRANNNNAISFGHTATATIGVPDYNGEDLQVTTPGNYTVSLNLTDAGNYVYGIQRNS